MCQNDAHRGCMITSAVEIGLNSLGFLITLGALKFQGKFNEVLEKAHQHIDLDINAASVICAFLFLGILTSSAGVHGYRSRNRWFYLIHLVFGVILSLCYFAIFIHSLVQFRQMRDHVDSVSDNPIASPLDGSVTSAPMQISNSTAAPIPEDTAAEKVDVQEIISKLGFPLAICFVQIALYLVSAQYAWKSWKDSDAPTIQREILEEEPEDKNEPV